MSQAQKRRQRYGYGCQSLSSWSSESVGGGGRQKSSADVVADLIGGRCTDQERKLTMPAERGLNEDLQT